MNNNTYQQDPMAQPGANSYLQPLLKHWHEIKNSQGIVYKQDFRPQDFGPYLPKMAMLRYDERQQDFEIRLSGSKSTQAFGLTPEISELHHHKNKTIRNQILSLVQHALAKRHPIYDEDAVQNMDGELKPVLALPFAERGTDVWSTIVLAFDDLS